MLLGKSRIRDHHRPSAPLASAHCPDGQHLLETIGDPDGHCPIVGQWPPTFLCLALLYKLLRPSHELGLTQTNRAIQEAAAVAG